jgi:hypothetical protein
MDAFESLAIKSKVEGKSSDDRPAPDAHAASCIVNRLAGRRVRLVKHSALHASYSKIDG